jgi:formylglycine-generating enzyme required for sulfatase activity
MSSAVAVSNWGGVAFPAIVLAGLLAVIGDQIGVRLPAMGEAMPAPTTVVVASRAFQYRAPGDFIRGNATIDGPLIHVTQPAPLEIMTHQVSAADYALCVVDGACSKATPRRRGIGNVPATGVNYDDAVDYAAWLSERTGSAWRLPTVEEWSFAAGAKAVDTALGIDATDPADRWLLAYEREAALDDDGAARPEPLGTFGINEFGVADLSAVVWEWTSTCGSRTTLDAAGKAVTHVESCGVRYLEGRHRTPMSTFIRDALGGACSVGRPPDNLGFRLVRERGWTERLGEFVGKLWH